MSGTSIYDIEVPDELKQLEHIDILLQNITEESFEETFNYLINYITDNVYLYDVFCRLTFFSKIRLKNFGFYLRLFDRIDKLFPNFKHLFQQTRISASKYLNLLTNSQDTENFIPELSYAPKTAEYIIKYDLFEEFGDYLNKNDVNDIELKISIDDYFYPMVVKAPTFAALYGSINIFKFLLINNVEINQNAAYFAALNGNYEIMHILHQNNYDMSLVLIAAVHSHRDDIYEWASTKLQCMEPDLFTAYHSYNIRAFFHLYHTLTRNFQVSMMYSFDLFKYLIEKCNFPLKKLNNTECAYFCNSPMAIKYLFDYTKKTPVPEIELLGVDFPYDICLPALREFFKNLDRVQIQILGSVFEAAVFTDQIETVKTFLEFGFDLNALDLESFIIMTKSVEMEKFLIDNDLKIDILHAINYCDIQTIAYMIEKGVDINKPSEYIVYEKRSNIIIQKYDISFMFPELVLKTEVPNHFLTYPKFNSFTPYITTVPRSPVQVITNMPLHFAVCCNRFDVVKLLIESGADVNSIDYKYRTPLFYCIDMEIKKLLISKGAKIDEKDPRFIFYSIQVDKMSPNTCQRDISWIHTILYENLIMESKRIALIKGKNKASNEEIYEALFAFSSKYAKNVLKKSSPRDTQNSYYNSLFKNYENETFEFTNDAKSVFYTICNSSHRMTFVEFDEIRNYFKLSNSYYESENSDHEYYNDDSNQ